MHATYGLNEMGPGLREFAGGKGRGAGGEASAGPEVVVAAQGPGADQVHGFLPNTRLFDIMMSAYGWKPDAKKK